MCENEIHAGEDEYAALTLLTYNLIHRPGWESLTQAKQLFYFFVILIGFSQLSHVFFVALPATTSFIFICRYFIDF